MMMQTLRTLRHMRASQVSNRLWRQIKRQWHLTRLYPRLFLKPGLPQAGKMTVPDLWPGDPEHGKMIAADAIRLIGRDHALTRPVNWNPQDEPYLWRFTLHYFEWLADLKAANDPQTARRMVADWIERFEMPDALGWHPYPTSLRLYAWLRHAPFLLDGADETFAAEFWVAIDRQARHLPRVLEKDIGGNHIIKNYKALIACAVCLPEQAPGLNGWLDALKSQLDIQILSDGGHYERSPSYHKQVLCDLMDLAALLGDRTPDWLTETIPLMRKAFALMLHPDGRMALFNDGTVGLPRLIAAMGEMPSPPESLPVTGYHRLEAGDTVVICDAAPVCPDNLPAHGHADTLSFEMSTNGHRMVVNGGTYAYQDPIWRHYLRETMAHSTVCIDKENSAEVYGVFRIGRRPKVITVDRDGSRLTASHDGYRHLGLIHERTWELVDEKTLKGRDMVTRTRGGASRVVAARFHLHHRVHPKLEDDGSVLLSFTDDTTWRFRATGGEIILGDSVYAPSFYHLYDTQKIKIETVMRGPETVFKWSLTREG